MVSYNQIKHKGGFDIMEPDAKKIEYHVKERIRQQNIREYQKKFFKNLGKRSRKGGKRK